LPTALTSESYREASRLAVDYRTRPNPGTRRALAGGAPGAIDGNIVSARVRAHDDRILRSLHDEGTKGSKPVRREAAAYSTSSQAVSSANF
jgi:hypothetical protein